jgi:hypothetical protein
MVGSQTWWVRLAEQPGLVSHAFVALDHDEYGAEHIVFDAQEGMLRRVRTVALVRICTSTD